VWSRPQRIVYAEPGRMIGQHVKYGDREEQRRKFEVTPFF
jgi:hypothetical protein